MSNKEEKTTKTEEKPQKTKDEQSLENRCPSCTASISFNPKLGKWKCDYCGSEFTLEEMKQHSDNASTDKKNAKKAVVEDNYDGYISYRCESCGAEIIADEQTAATFCVYCGNTAILQSKLSGKFAPEMIIPFKRTREEAVENFKALSKGRPLMPRDFNNVQNIEKIRGIYIPFWLYDVNISGDLVMNATRVTSWVVGDTHYTKTDTYKVTRGGSLDFEKIPTDASTRFDNDIMNSIEPFHYQYLEPYNHAYLSGFYAEKYDEEPEKMFPEASDRALNSARNVLKNDARTYTTKVVVSDTLAPKETARTYALLPVWMVNVKYNNKMHIFAMNGETGEFIGNIPLDGKRTVLFSLMIFSICMIVCIIVTFIMFLAGGM